jgi:hypothetical protein
MNTAWQTRAITLTLALFCGWLGGWALRNVFARETNQHKAAIARQSDQLNPAEMARANRVQPVAFFDRLHEALGIQDRAKRKRAIASLADDLDASQVCQNLERVAASHIPNRKEVMTQLFARWGELVPIAAMAFVNELPKLTDRPDAVSAVLNAWMEHDPAAAEKWVRTLPAGALRNEVWITVILAHAASDPARALVLAQQAIISWSSSSTIAEAIFGNWTLNDPKTAAARAFQLPEGMLRTDALQIVAKQWAETDPAQAIKWAQSLPDRLVPERVSLGGSATYRGADRTNTTTEILGPWLRRDRDAVFQWLADLPDDPWKTSMVSTACKYSVENLRDPEMTVQMARFLPQGGEMRYGMLCEGAIQLAEHDPKAGLAMLSYETDKAARLTILEGLASSLKGDDLLTALREVQADGTAIGNLTRWADPETAAHWALQQPESEKYLPKIGAAWLVKDPEGAQEFVRTLPPPLRDDALSRAVLTFESGPREVAIQKFERAAVLIPEIANPELRESTYRKLAEHWLWIEPASARRWIESAPIASGLKNELLKP